MTAEVTSREYRLSGDMNRLRGALDESRRIGQTWRELYDAEHARAERFRAELADRVELVESQSVDPSSGTGERVRVELGHRTGQTWTIADVEEVAYRFRLAGGSDDTRVGGIGKTLDAVVPAPNLISLHPVGGSPEPSPTGCTHPGCRAAKPRRRWTRADTLFAAALVVVVLVALVRRWWGL